MSLGMGFNHSRSVKASAGRSTEGVEKTDGGQFAGPVMEVTTLDRGFANSTTVDFPVWDKIGAVVRLTYGIGEYLFNDVATFFWIRIFIKRVCFFCFLLGVYGAMAVAGRFICSVTGIDSSGGFDPSLDALLAGLGYATPPIMALLFILDVRISLLLILIILLGLFLNEHIFFFLASG